MYSNVVEEEVVDVANRTGTERNAPPVGAEQGMKKCRSPSLTTENSNQIEITFRLARS